MPAEVFSNSTLSFHRTNARIANPKAYPKASSNRLCVEFLLPPIGQGCGAQCYFRYPNSIIVLLCIFLYPTSILFINKFTALSASIATLLNRIMTNLVQHLVEQNLEPAKHLLTFDAISTPPYINVPTFLCRLFDHDNTKWTSQHYSSNNTLAWRKLTNGLWVMNPNSLTQRLNIHHLAFKSLYSLA